MAESATNARNQAQEATSKATDTVRAQVDQRSSDVGEKVASTATDIRSVGDHLRQQGKEQPAKVADRAAKQVERAGTWLRESDSDRILHDIEDFGRRQPWAFAVGGLAMGMVAARLLKASSSKRYQQHRQLAPASNGIGSAGGHPPGLGDTPTYRREAERLDVTRKTPPATSAAPAAPSSGANEVA
jgi:uncharacterized membrane-anchored protein YhcB (DUF1043 family)